MSRECKIGMLTSWNTQCGISEYSKYLVTAMRKAGHDVTVLGSKNYDERKVAEDESYVIPVFGVLPWNRYGDHSFDVEAILAQNFDVIHVQYEVLLYNQAGFNRLWKEFKGLKVLTYHDNCIPPDFPAQDFDLFYTHRESVGLGSGYILPFGIENRPPVVKTFGLGRSRDDIIAAACLRLGYGFQSSFGEQDWKSTEELHQWLRDSDAIVLYYADVPSAGSSQAARTAIATRRPVIVNNVTWFEGVEGVYRVNTPEELEAELFNLLDHPIINRDSWDLIAETIYNDYQEKLNA